MNPYRSISTKQTPQSQPILGAKQIKNDAGGYVFKLGDWERFERFLILGTAGGTYYVGQQKLTRDNADLIVALLKVDGHEVVRRIVAVSEGGRAPKQDPALFALAVVASLGNDEVRVFALNALPRVARTASALFSFLTYVQQFRGWGRGLRTGVQRWYDTRAAEKNLDYQLIKYRNRDGWTHRDVLRKSHAFGSGYPAYIRSMAWAAGKGPAAGHELLEAFEAAQRAEDPARTIQLLHEYPSLPRESLQPEHLNDAGVWLALVQNGMPMTALLRNLATMTRVGLLAPFSEATRLVGDQLQNPDALRRARVHPFAILMAMRTYASGHGERGRNTWTPVQPIVDALDAAFYASFEQIEPTGKRHVLGLDVSPSMFGNYIAGSSLTAGEAVGALAMATAAVEPHMFFAFTHQLAPVSISPRQRLDDVSRQLRDLGWNNYGGTDAAQPILAAIRQRIEADVFVTYTDNETWRGSVHPVQALRQYRQVMGIPAKLVVVGMTATRSTIGDPDDPATLDVVGFDTATPSVIADFVR